VRIVGPTISVNRSVASWEASVHRDGGRDVLKYSVPAKYADALTRNLDPALAGLIVPAIDAGEDLYLDGPVSTELLAQVQTEAVALLSIVRGAERSIRVDATDRSGRGNCDGGTITGFSAGIDSFNVLLDYYFGVARPEHRVSHLLFNNVGSHGRHGDSLFRERATRIKAVADELQLPLVLVDSNLDRFYTSSFVATHTIRNATVPFSCSKGSAATTMQQVFMSRERRSRGQNRWVMLIRFYCHY